MDNPTIIALYLPQFHPFSENDEWWGKGFTEWTNVGRAKPLFRGHYQPRVPADLGYYDLRLKEVREEQVKLAIEAGVSGFCYWHYWFGNGKRLMNQIFDEVLTSGKPNFPFCLGWANHSWYSKNWNSNDSKKDILLIEQKYLGIEDYRMHYDYLLKAFNDKRYMKIENKPIFMIYDSHNFPAEIINYWNIWAKEDGFEDGIYFIGHVFYNDDIKSFLMKGYNALIKIRYYSYFKQNIMSNIWGQIKIKVKKDILKVPHPVEYKKVIKSLIDKEDVDENLIPTLIPNFDHSPRSGIMGLIYNNSSPELFKEHVKMALKVVNKKKNKIIFLKSWNEWGEGNYMEPDIKFGKGYIEALNNALKENENLHIKTKNFNQ